MLNGLAIVLAFQLLGEAVARTTHAPVPGPVVGLVFFFCYLRLRRPAEDAPELRASDALLRVLPMLFVPAGIGIVSHLDALGAQLLPISAGLVGSWAVALLGTGLVASWLRPRSLTGATGAEPEASS